MTTQWVEKTASTTMTKKQYVTHLRRNKLRCIGDGVFAHVFDHPAYKKRVLKVVDPDDYAYLRYIRHLNRYHVSNPSFPHVYSLKGYYCGESPSFYVAELERLQVLPFYNEDRSIFTHKLLKAIDHLILFEGTYVHSLAQTAYNLLTTQEYRALKMIRRMYDKYDDMSWDLNTNNVMRRGSQLVFTDPLSPNLTTF